MSPKSLLFRSILFLLLSAGSTIPAWSQVDTFAIVGGAEFDSRVNYSATAGVSLVWEQCGRRELLCFSNNYVQLLGKYNFTSEAIGIQPSWGFSDLFGGRIGLDLEYSTRYENMEALVFVAGGFDLGGSISLVVGPKLNLTRNHSDQRFMVHTALHFPFLVRHPGDE